MEPSLGSIDDFNGKASQQKNRTVAWIVFALVSFSIILGVTKVMVERFVSSDFSYEIRR